MSFLYSWQERKQGSIELLRGWMIHGIDHDRIPKFLLPQVKSCFGDLCVLSFSSCSTSENPIVPCCLCFFYDVERIEVARVVAKVRLRGLALPSAAASGRCHRRRRLQFHLRITGTRFQQSTHFHLLFERHYSSQWLGRLFCLLLIRFLVCFCFFVLLLSWCHTLNYTFKIHTNWWDEKTIATTIKTAIDWWSLFLDWLSLLLNRVEGLVVSSAVSLSDVRSAEESASISSSGQSSRRWASSLADWMDLPWTSYGEMQ